MAEPLESGRRPGRRRESALCGGRGRASENEPYVASDGLILPIVLVVGRGMQPVIVGTMVGFLIAAGVTRFLSRLLFGVSPRDPATLALVALAMLGTALVAVWLPASRAARLEPAQVLRLE